VGEVAAAADGLSKSGAKHNLVAAAQPSTVITEKNSSVSKNVSSAMKFT